MVGDHRVKEEEGGKKKGDEGEKSELNETSEEQDFALPLTFTFVFFVFACLTHGNIIFDILEQSSFQKYTTCWVFLALRHMLYLRICVFCICISCIRAFNTWEYHI